MIAATKTIRKTIRILLVDDHQVVRDGLQHMLEQEEDFNVVGHGANAEETLARIETLSPDIVMMDIKMPGVDGIELTRRVKKKFPECKIIMLTLYDHYLSQAMEAGANGYLLKDIRADELACAIRRVFAGETVSSENISALVKYEYEKKNNMITVVFDEPMVEELQISLPPPVGANTLMKLCSSIESALDSKVLRIIGSREEGLLMTVSLNRAMPFASILDTLRGVPEVGSAEKESPAGMVGKRLLETAGAAPKTAGRSRKTVFLTLLR